MAEADAALASLILRGREDRNLEYKGTRGVEPFAWGPARVNATIAKTAMAMANLGGGAIVIGMDQVGPDRWEANGVSRELDASYRRDRVQQYVNRRADPFVELVVSYVSVEQNDFVIIQISGFDELPVVCTDPVNGILRPGALYTRPMEKHETAEIRTQSEMRELLDRAIEVGVRARLRPVFAAIRESFPGEPWQDPAARQFDQQRGSL